LWSFGRYDLRLSEDEVWGLTLRELRALSDRHKDSQSWLDYRAALICTVMANMWRDPKSKALVPSDFMPGEKTSQQTPEQMLATVKLLNSAYGGNVVEE